MVSGTLATLLLTIGVASAAPGHIPSSHIQKRAEGIKWGDCNLEVPTEGLPVQCGTLTVPLDYTDDANTETITLELIKLPAAKQPAPKGSILLNFGGPGQDGVTSFIGYIGLQGPIIGDQHDIISWDPRGTRNTLTFRCWDDPNAGTLTTEWYNSSDANPSRLWAEGTIASELCYNRLKDIGNHVGMAPTSRDIISIVDALGEDGLVRYWGISGGTALGATLAAMFPERMDKIILDGVMNSKQYYGQSVETEWFSSTDDTLRGILTACATVGEERCPLAAHGKHEKDLELIIDELLADLKYHPIPTVSTLFGVGYSITYPVVMPWLYDALYRPIGYKNVTLALDALIRRDGEDFVKYSYGRFGLDLDTIALSTTAYGMAQATANGTTIAPPTPVYGIRCGDKAPRQDSLEALQEVMAPAAAASKWFSGFGIGQNAILCAQWKFHAKDRYDGNFEGIKTKNPILFIGNSYDPATPLVSAKNMSSGFEGSVVLEHKGYGHVSFLPMGDSDCTNKAIHDYLYDGVLPKPGTQCETNLQLVDLF